MLCGRAVNLSAIWQGCEFECCVTGLRVLCGSNCVIVHACKCSCGPCREVWKVVASRKGGCQETPRSGHAGSTMHVCRDVCRSLQHASCSDSAVVHVCACSCTPCRDDRKVAALQKRWYRQTPRFGCGGAGRVRDKVTNVSGVATSHVGAD